MAYGLQAVVGHHYDQVTKLAIIIVVSALISNLLFVVATLTINTMGIRGQEYVQRVVLANFLEKDYEFYTNSYSGSLGSQAANLRTALGMYDLTMVFNGTRYVVVIGSGLVVIALKSWLLALITLVCMAIILSFTVLFADYRRRARRDLSEAESNIAGVLVDSLSQGATVKSFANEPYELHRLDHALVGWKKAIARSWLLSIPQNTGRNILLAITMGILLVVSSKLYQAGTISLAIIALVQFYVIRLMSMTIDIADSVKMYDAAMSQAHAGAVTMLQPRSILDPKNPKRISDTSRLVLSLENVSYKYPDTATKREAVQDFNLTVQPGEKVGIVGYSGSGKTTLTKLLLRFMDTSSGAIKLNGVDIRDITQAELRSYVAYVPQEPLLFHRSVKENIAYAKPDASPEEVDRVAKTAYIDEFVQELPQGYETLVGERGVKLSGGQRQRVAIARALLKDAPILVLDEATSALDSQSEQYIQKALWRLMKDRTAIVVAHRLSTIQHMDTIVVMDKGKVVEVGSHEELLAKKQGIYAQLWQHQSGGYIGVPEVEDETSKS